MQGRRTLVAVLAGAICCVAAPPVQAATYNVNTAADPAGAGCAGGTCSLRQAIDAVNNGSGTGDVINLPAGNYSLLLGDLRVDLPVSIVGAGARVTAIDANGLNGVIYFQPGSSSSSLSGITLTGGSASAINNEVFLTVTDTTVTGNFDSDTGGGIYNDNTATLIVERTTITGNQAQTVGGGIYNQGVLTLTNSTVSGNIANGSGSTWTSGGIDNSGNAIVVNSTIAGNTAFSGGGIVNSDTFTIKNTIVADNTGTGTTDDNCADDPLTSMGGNLEDTNTCNFNQPSDQINTPAGIGSLQNNGGPTDTRALLAGSAAIDKGVNCPPPDTDQRGVTRPQGVACDVGAYELQVVAPPDTVVPVASGLKLTPSAFRARGSGGSVMSAAKRKKRAKVGTTVAYTLSEAATTTFTVERRVKGRKNGKKCSTTRKRGKRCTTYKLVKGSFTQNSAAGANSLKFSGRVGGKKLKPGSYRLVIVPRDAAGNFGTAQRKAFRIVR